MDRSKVVEVTLLPLEELTEDPRCAWCGETGGWVVRDPEHQQVVQVSCSGHLANTVERVGGAHS